MATVVIIVIIAILAGLSIKANIKHIKGEGACCGGGGCELREESRILEGPSLMQVEFTVDQMHCDNCANRIIRSLQKIDGVSAAVDLRTKKVDIQTDREVDIEDLKFAITRVGYKIND